jgi:hypothetical protein
LAFERATYGYLALFVGLAFLLLGAVIMLGPSRTPKPLLPSFKICGLGRRMRRYRVRRI